MPARAHLSARGTTSRGHQLSETIAIAIDGPVASGKTAVGKLVAERALAKGITQVVFDRGGYKYHGRVKALGEASREQGLKF